MAKYRLCSKCLKLYDADWHHCPDCPVPEDKSSPTFTGIKIVVPPNMKAGN